MSIIKYNRNLKVNVIKSVYLVTRQQHSKSSLLFSINTIRQTNKNHQTINPLLSTPSRLQLQHLQNYYWSNSHKRRPSITKGVFHKGERRGEEGRRGERGGGEERGEGRRGGERGAIWSRTQESTRQRSCNCSNE